MHDEHNELIYSLRIIVSILDLLILLQWNKLTSI